MTGALAGALDGLRVLDLSRLLPGPFCSLLLADMGADVVKIEDPQGGDYIRWIPPYIQGRGAQFMALNRNKKSCKLNLKHPRGVELLLKLTEQYDVVLDSFRPGVLDRLGAGYEAARARNPRIIYCAITGYGQDGPYRDRAGHDLNYIGYAGSLSLTGNADRPPVIPGVQVGDLGAALLGAVGILSAVIAREKTGAGQFVDAAMMDAAMGMLPLVMAMVAGGEPAPQRGESMLNGGQPVYGVYETRDGLFVNVGAIEPKFWKKFCALVQRPDLEMLHFDTGAGRDKLHAEMTAMFKTRTRAQWMDLLEEQDVCVGPVLSLDEAMQDPHALARNMIVDVDTHSGPVKQTGTPIKFSATPPSLRMPPPEFGEHTAEILAQAGVDAAELEQLQSQGVI
jgi:crotonobetainyl-CoA:carnitine CoA-transferase CaiB-like acyl-CoA transferase